MPLTYTMKTAAAESGLSTRKLYDLIKAGTLESTKVGRRRLIVARSLEKILLGPNKDAQTTVRG
jgi:excisionase family DNA binding protein